jgi:hypothetical protein
MALGLNPLPARSHSHFRVSGNFKCIQPFTPLPSFNQNLESRLARKLQLFLKRKEIF